MSWATLVGRGAAGALALCLGLAGAAGCGSVERAAAHDPMRCERDPACSKGRDNYADCTKQCVDDPECTDRCRTMQVDRVGAP
jgi:hypothetical protein